ncbi:hypothetical protein ACLOJK_030152 [Asimina triloba]
MAVDGMGHDGGGMNDSVTAPPNMPHGGKGTMMMVMHMTFFWGKAVEVLFSGWPGEALAMYLLALFFVFALAVTVEGLSASRLLKPGPSNWAARTGLHALRVGLAYLLMLAVMSFNGGVFLVAVAGHALGFLIFGSGAFKRFEPEAHDRENPTPLKC